MAKGDKFGYPGDDEPTKKDAPNEVLVRATSKKNAPNEVLPPTASKNDVDFEVSDPPATPKNPKTKNPVGRPPRKVNLVGVPGLFLGSQPRACPELNEIRVDLRRVLCRRYENCLNFAFSQNWSGFDCTNCEIDEKITIDDHRRDLEGLANFLVELNIKLKP